MQNGSPTNTIPPGLKLLCTLRGAKGQIQRISWSPDGRMLAIPSIYGDVRLWGVNAGALPKVLEGHQSSVYATAWSHNGKHIASVSEDKTLRLWDVANGKSLQVIMSYLSYLLSVAWSPDGQMIAVAGGDDYSIEMWDIAQGVLQHRLTGHSQMVSALAWSPNGQMLASCSNDATVRLWDRSGGPPRFTLEQQGNIRSVVWSPDGEALISGSADKTICLWDPASGRKMGTLEGHTGEITALSFSFDGKLLASNSKDGTVRLWHYPTRETLAILPKTNAMYSLWAGLAFHPTALILATLDEGDRVVCVWDLELDALEPKNPTVHYVNAKVVLVGESSVGKSGLGIRIAESQFRATESTHGAQFWHIPLPPQALSNRFSIPNVRVELTLWDLAGQPEYHLIHQLFLDDTDVALLLFDCSDPSDPFRGVPYWAKVLRKQAPPFTLKLLVSSRSDVSPVTVDRKTIQRFLNRYDLDGYFVTSAKTGEGVSPLMRHVLQGIPWEKLPRTTTPHLFQIIREFLLECKSSLATLITLDEVTRQVRARYAENPASDAEIDTVINLLEARGLIYRLDTVRGEKLILLRPERVNQYAASIIQAARRHQRGIGATPERDVLTANIPLIGFERLPQTEEKIVLEATVELLIHHDLCFREMGLLVFPSQINVSRPSGVQEHPPTEVTYEFSGSVEAIYASLVVRLSYTDYFQREEQWKHAVEFSRPDIHTNIRHRLGFAMRQIEEGTGEIEIYFYPGVNEFDRVTFIRFITDHLKTKGIDIKERIRLYCPSCHKEVQNREAIENRVLAGKLDIPCQYCDTAILIPHSIEERYRSDQAYVEKQRQLAAIVEQRTHQEIREFQTDRMHYGAPTADQHLHILHLSDLQICANDDVSLFRARLENDLFQELDIRRLDYLVISGDVASHALPEEYRLAFEFLDGLAKRFGLDPQRIVVVPGNHDVNWEHAEAAYTFVPKRKLPDPLPEGSYISAGDAGALLRDDSRYPQRFTNFSQHFYKKIHGGTAYPLTYAAQGILQEHPNERILFLALNSAWEIDYHYKARTGIHPETLARVLEKLQEGTYTSWLKIAVVHHDLGGVRSRNGDLLQLLVTHGFQICLHGHVHETEGLYVYDARRDLHLIGAGTSGAFARKLPGIPLQYNLLTLDRDGGKITVETRKKETPDGVWFADARWGDRNNPSPRYTIPLQNGKRVKEKLKAKAFEALTQEPYEAYETGLRNLLERMTPQHPRYDEALIYQHRLVENIAKARRYKDNSDLESARIEVLDRLEQLSRDTLGVTFTSLCQ
ncbi:MAG: metallophosphoesterase [Anaerolineae bacterium]|nr:metallophosphoesterase [Anaerolineae bacterium]